MLVVYLLVKEPEIVVDLVYLSALFMMARSVDYTFPYLRAYFFLKYDFESESYICVAVNSG